MCHLAARTKGKFNLFFLSRNRIACIEKTSMALSIIDRYSGQLVACLSQEPEVLSLIPGPATYFCFSFC